MKLTLTAMLLPLILFGCTPSKTENTENAPQQALANGENPIVQMQGTYEITKFQFVSGEGRTAPYFDDNCTAKAIYTFDKPKNEICMKTQWECKDMQDFGNDCYGYNTLYTIADVFGTEEKFTIVYDIESGIDTRTAVSGERTSKDVQKLDDTLFWKWTQTE